MELINEKDYKKTMAERVEPFLEKIRTNGFFESLPSYLIFGMLSKYIINHSL